MLKLTMISAVDKNKSNLLLLTRFVLHCALLENFSRRVREMILVASGYEAYCRLFHNVDLIHLKFQRILRPPSRSAHVYINNTNIIGVILTKYWGWINIVVSLNPALPFCKNKNRHRSDRACHLCIFRVLLFLFCFVITCVCLLVFKALLLSRNYWTRLKRSSKY